MARVFTYLIIFLFCQAGLKAQDVHFSQFYSSPLLLNPALTGVIGGDVRAVSNYRQQWDTYKTYAFAIDAKVMGCNLDNKDMGVGLLLYNDRSGEVGFSTSQVMLSYAYQRKFESLLFSAGVQAGVGQKRFDLNSAIFPSQVGYSGTYPQLLPGEYINNTNFIYPDFALGTIGYYEPSKKVSYFLGASAFHVLRPKINFLMESDNRIGRRIVGTGGANIEINKYVVVMPNFIFMYQNEASEFNIGSNFSYKFPDNEKTKELFLGLWGRSKDALIILTGFQLDKIRLGLSYDITTSKLAGHSSANAFEVSLLYVTNAWKPRNEDCYRSSPKNLSCPLFR